MSEVKGVGRVNLPSCSVMDGLLSSELSVSSSFFSARNLSANDVWGRGSASSSLPSGLVLPLAAVNGFEVVVAPAVPSESSLES